jgi:hypothetical protein
MVGSLAQSALGGLAVPRHHPENKPPQSPIEGASEGMVGGWLR